MKKSIFKKAAKKRPADVLERHSELLALEPRIVFDAAGVATIVTATNHPATVGDTLHVNNTSPTATDTLHVASLLAPVADTLQVATPAATVATPAATASPQVAVATTVSDTLQIASNGATTSLNVPPATGTVAPSGGDTPIQLRQAYGVDQITYTNGTVTGDGTGQTIAIVDAYNDPNIAADLATFDAAFGIAAPPSFSVVNQNGLGGNLPVNDSTGWSLEISLDVEWAHAMAPNAKIILVEANSNSLSDLFTAIQTAENLPGVSVVSMSFGANEFAGDTSNDAVFNNAAVTFVASTGDDGSPGGVTNYPATSSNVLAVGGTDITVNGANQITSESAWADGGGGISAYESQPAYQNGIVTGFSATKRTIPDIAFDAGTPVDICDSYDYGATPWVSVEGTSIGAPCWAGLVAIADQGRVIAGQPVYGNDQFVTALYGLSSSDFNDITTGSNGTYAARAGYDLVTGLGTPKANLIMADLGNNNATGTNETITTFENVPYTFATTDFGFTDTNGAQTLSAVEITTLPGLGTLRDNGAIVTAGEFISAADITAHKLIYTPAQYGVGSPYDTFTFQVEDHAGSVDPAAKTLTVDVTAVNQAPVGTSTSVGTIENTPYTFAAGDFGFTDPHDSPANTLMGVEITTLPTHGTLTDNGVVVTAGQIIAAADITGGLLQFTPAAGGNGGGYAHFTFQVEDNGGTANGGHNLDTTPKTMTLNVTALNEPPTLLAGNASTFINKGIPLNLSFTPGYGETPDATFTINNIPAGVQLIGPGGTIAIAGGTATVAIADIASVTLVPPTDFLGTFSLSITASNTDINSATTSTTKAFSVFVQDVPITHVVPLPPAPSMPHGVIRVDNYINNTINVGIDIKELDLTQWTNTYFNTGFPNPVDDLHFVMNADTQNAFVLPESLFWGNGKYTFEAQQANGDDLPSWLSFNPKQLSFKGVPPDGTPKDMYITVVATDSTGHEMEVPLHVVIGHGISEHVQTPDIHPQEQHTPDKHLPAKHAAVKHTAFNDPVGRASFSAQLQQAAYSGHTMPQSNVFDYINTPLAAS